MIIHDKRNRVSKKCNIRIGGERIKEVNEAKYLGVIIDRFLTFENHAYYISKEVNKKISFLRRISSVIGDFSRVLD